MGMGGTLGHAGKPRAPLRVCGSGRGGAGRGPPCPARTQPRKPTGTADRPPWPRTSSPPRPADRQRQVMQVGGWALASSLPSPAPRAGPSLSCQDSTDTLGLGVATSEHEAGPPVGHAWALQAVCSLYLPPWHCSHWALRLCRRLGMLSENQT